MRLAENVALKLDDDPRPSRDFFNRIRVMVEEQAIDPAWGCALYRLFRVGRIDADEREAGDKYWKIVNDYRRVMATDPEELAPEARELAYKRVAKIKREFRDVWDCLGLCKSRVDALILDDVWPDCERGHKTVKLGLNLLKIFFETGTKRVRNVV